MLDTPESLNRHLQQQGRRYQALSPVDCPQVRIRFPGPFEGRTVIWDAELRTLAYERDQADPQSGTTPSSLRQYIHIYPADGEQVPITIALNVPLFDEPAILKTIIMIHNYKKLRPGRHEFGEPVEFTD